jgi:alkyldihydroxyacetonephosphate synthase
MNREAPLEQWNVIKKRASDAIRDHGGTISHHHGVGADHLPWMKGEKGETGMKVLHSIRKEVDPRQIMNPGKTF